MERFKFNHPEYGTDICWCPDCIGGETLTKVNEVSARFDTVYIKEKH